MMEGWQKRNNRAGLERRRRRQRRLLDHTQLYPPARRDDGIGKRIRSETEGGKTHALSERALSAIV